MNRPDNYGIIYNWDGAPHGYSAAGQSLDEFLELTYAPLADTQVGALFWCMGEHSARWQSQRLEQLGDIHGRLYENTATYHLTENIRRMTERGEDPQAALIERGRELGLAVYASLRINDNHFEGAQVSDLPRMHHTELTELRRQHPEWLLGDRTSEWFALSWDLSIPQVRQHRLDHLREICERWDWDGIELDWQRHPFHLPEDEAWRLRYTLTDLQRAARQLTNDIAQRRGRPLHVAVRVAGTLASCARIGYDVAAWIDEDLCDIVIPAGAAATDPSLDIRAFVDLCQPRGIRVYGGFDGGLPDPWVGPEDRVHKDQLRTRAIASRYHAAGADGVYAFNWHADADRRRLLLTQIGSSSTLRGTDGVFAATHRFLVHEGPWRGAYRPDRTLGQVPVPLRQTLTGCGPVVDLDLTDVFTSAPVQRVELRLHLCEWVDGDEVVIKWDGQVLPAPTYSLDLTGDTTGVSRIGGAVWLRFALAPERITAGMHRVETILQRRHPQLACDLVLTDVELAVACSDTYASSLLPA
ncbi:MAG: hypothetical protein O2782_11615 [bacterium]|nr:hypothetical protein [bacterium]